MSFKNLTIEGFEHYQVNENGDVLNTSTEDIHLNNSVVTHIILTDSYGLYKSFSIRYLVDNIKVNN